MPSHACTYILTDPVHSEIMVFKGTVQNRQNLETAGGLNNSLNLTHKRDVTWSPAHVTQWLKPRPHQQQCRAILSNATSRTILSTKLIQIEHAQFVSTFTKNSFDIVGKNDNNVEETFDFVERIVRLVAFDHNVASTVLLRHCCWCERGA